MYIFIKKKVFGAKVVNFHVAFGILPGYLKKIPAVRTSRCGLLFRFNLKGGISFRISTHQQQPKEAIWMFPKIGGKNPKMDGENNG